MLVLERLQYFGPGRRSERTVIEWLLDLEAGEGAAIRSGLAAAGEALSERFGIDRLSGDVPSTSEPLFALAAFAGRLALELQCAAGHRVAFHAVVPDAGAGRCRLLFEYEHGDTGADAGDIAMRLLADAVPGLRWQPDENVPGESTAEALALFLQRARQSVLPRDAEAIIAAAARLDVPCVKLDRDPYQGLRGKFRIRPNGLLKLGHSCHQRIVDGTLCLDRSAGLVPLLFDRERLLARMNALGLPLAPGARPLAMTRHVLRAAQQLGYPVVLKPVKRLASEARGVPGVRRALDTEREVLEELSRLRAQTPRVQMERFVAGETFRILVADGRLLSVIDAAGSEAGMEALHPSTRALAERAAADLDCGLLAINIVTPDPGRPLAAAGGIVASLDPAPQLDRLLASEPASLDRAAEAFVRWLFPPGARSRIPLVAVTGTNGKTTTSRLIARIAKTAGRAPGLASTAGVYIDGELHEAGDQAGGEGHHLLLESRAVDFGVLETARGGVATCGFMFDRCDVGVCLNVTDDHVGEFGIDTLEAMAAIKRSVLERAAGIVLNADYATCLGMLPFAPGVRVCLCSLSSDAGTLLERAGPGGAACVIERTGADHGDDREWLVWYGAGERRPVLPVEDFPAALGGAARFNLSNAQHAIGAARLLGFDFEIITAALRGFDASFENNPGRLNVYRGHPFTVIMDYAHNPDGMDKLFECMDRLALKGRRILLYAAAGNRADIEVVRHTLHPVGRVDHFVVRRYPVNLRGRAPDEIPRMMHAALREAGVPEDRITLADPPEQGAVIAMRLAQPGDVVILTPGTGEYETMWEQVRSFPGG